MSSQKIKPFLKWAGRKYNIMEHIKRKLPQGKILIEPFVGSAAVFLNTDFEKYILCDLNQDLINLFRCVKNEGKIFINYAKKIFIPENNTSETYYALRNQFNQSNALRERARLFLYLNRHGYNGLCRYNSQGQYNVPFGRHRNPQFPEEELYLFHGKAKQAEFHCCDYQTIMNKAKKGDVIYCDPPYVPLSPSANFTHYHLNYFTNEDHKKLAKSAQKLSKKGVTVLISNHDTEFTRTLYQPAEIESFAVKRSISCNSDSRKKAPEILALFNKNN